MSNYYLAALADPPIPLGSRANSSQGLLSRTLVSLAVFEPMFDITFLRAWIRRRRAPLGRVRIGQSVLHLR